MSLKLVYVLAILWLVVPVLRSGADELTDTRQRLTAIAERLKDAEAAVRDNRGDINQVFAALEKLQTERYRIGARIDTLERRQQQLTDEITAVKRSIAALHVRSDERRELLQKRLIAMYKSGESGVLPLLFGSASPDSAAEDYLFFSLVATSDQALLNEARTQQQQLEADAARLKTLVENQAQTRSALLGQRQELTASKKLQEQTLQRLERRSGGLQAELSALRRQAEALRALVKKLESSRGAKYTLGAGDFGKQRGRLQPPVAAPIQFGFGMRKRPGDEVLVDSNGLEFSVTPGLVVNAVWSGQVVFADSFRGFGRLLIINHGGGYYSLYAHAEKLFKTAGEQVAVGEKIAQTGDRCYFEIRYQGAPIDPRPWIKLQR